MQINYPKITVIYFFQKTDTHVFRQKLEGIKPKNLFLHRLVFFCSSKVPNNKKITMVNADMVLIT